MSFKVFSCLFFFYVCSLTAEYQEKKPFVTCQLSGQLGNQLHQIATTLAYAWDHNRHPIFPIPNQNEYNIKKNFDTIFFRLDKRPLPRPVQYVFSFWDNFVKKDIPIKDDILLNGGFQTWEYYHHHRNKLLKLFSPKKNRLDKIKARHHALLHHPHTVAVHVRTFNEKWISLIPFVGLDYYEKAFSYFPANALFVIFSDRINWCKHHFAKFNRPMVFIEGQEYIDDFFLMSRLKHNIIGNSSFSWWAAYLNTNPNQVVIAPSHFVQPTVRAKTNALLPEWIELTIDCNAPYPKDMKVFDTYSQSIDSQ